MTEPDVTLTDYAVALECMLFIFLLQRTQARLSGMRTWFMLFFVSVGIASLCGGTVHGFFLDQQSWGNAILWPSTMLAMGVTALSMWAIGAELLIASQVVRWVLAAAWVQFGAYSIVVLFGSREFWVGIVDNLPALFFLLLALGITYRRTNQWRILLAAVGPVLVVVAAALQNLRIGVHPTYFNHNALYHVLQALALVLLFQGGRWLLEVQPLVQDSSSEPTHPATFQKEGAS
jgi:hypothetical protein